MTTKYEDDITEEQYGHESVLERFGIIAFGDLLADIDVHTDVVHDDPDRVADALHELVDDWVEDFKSYEADDG